MIHPISPLLLCLLVATASSHLSLRHQAASAEDIKQQLLVSIGRFTDDVFAKELKADLEESSEEKRTMKEISVGNAYQVFSVLDLDDPKCDKNGDGTIKGEELTCFSYIKQHYQPRD